MATTNANVLLVEDDEIDQMNFSRLVKKEALNYDYKIAATIAQARALLDQENFDIIISDFSLPDGSGLDILEISKGIPVIIITGVGDEEIAVNALKEGAFDYLIKDHEQTYLKVLPNTITKAIRFKRAEETLHQIQFEQSIMGVFLLKPSGVLINCNQTFAQIMGYPSKQDLLREKAFNFFRTWPDSDQILNELRQTHYLTSQELKLQNRNKQTIYVLANLGLVDDPAQAHEVIQGTLIDITSQKHNEERLRLLGAAVDSSIDGISITDQRNQDATLVYASPSLMKMTGYDANEIWQTNYGFLQGNDRDQPEREIIRNAMAAGEKCQVVLRNYKKDGSLFWNELTLYPLFDDNGDLTHYVGIQRDVTERKEAEEKLAQERNLLAQRVAERTADLRTANNELARAAQLKDEFLASMSHELRTPLNAILGLSEALREGIYGPITSIQRSSLNHITDSGRHLLSLINDILDVSKIEAGKLELNMNDVSVEFICQASINLVKQMAFNKKLNISTKYNNTVKYIQADERRLKQILVNLLSNAVKFTPDGGSIGLETNNDPATKMVQFIVWDTGIGISDDDITSLFQPFVQVDSSLSRKHAGTGLGLTLVYRMTEMHGGHVTIDSAVNEGTRFTVSLPWAPSHQRKSTVKMIDIEHNTNSHPSATYQEHTGYDRNDDTQVRVLLAEDNENNIETVESYLEVKGYQVIVCRNGYEAVNLTQQLRPDIVLMDIQMPEMDGLEAIRTIRTHEPLLSIPIIAMTALAMPGDRQRCLNAGANSYLSKPVILRELSELIASLTGD